MLDCLGLGIAPADILFEVAGFPKPGTKIDALKMTIQGGGPIPTAMATLSKLGGKAGLIAAVGDDYWGDFVLRELKKFGVNIDAIVIKKEPTALAIGWYESGGGRRTIILNREIHVDPRDFKWNRLPPCRAIHLDGRDLPACLKLARFAKQARIPVIMDVGSLRNDVSSLFPLVDHLICAEDFALPFSGRRKIKDAIARLRRVCAGTIVITSGIKGSTGFDKETGYVFQKAYRTITVDTTGAGDVYHGAYIYGLARKWDLRKRMNFASAAAALKCSRPGGRIGIPTYRRTVAFLKERGSIL
jgi:ribokinase